MPKKILVVDDEPEIVILLERRLKKEGFEVLKAFDGETALNIIEKKLPDLVILDLNLPGIHGSEVLKKIKENEKTSSTPVLILTAVNTSASIVKNFELGATAYLEKPINPKELLSHIQLALKSSEA